MHIEINPRRVLQKLLHFHIAIAQRVSALCADTLQSPPFVLAACHHAERTVFYHHYIITTAGSE